MAIRVLCVKSFLLFTTLIANPFFTFALPNQPIAANVSSVAQRFYSYSRGFNDPCENGDTCGSYALCYQGKCRCFVGYIPTNVDNNGEECVQVACVKDDDCARFEGTECSHNGICLCADILDWNSQTCTSLISDSFKRMALIVAIVVIVLITLTILISLTIRYVVRRRRQDQATSPKLAAPPIQVEQTVAYCENGNQVLYQPQFSRPSQNQNSNQTSFIIASNGHS